MTKNKKILILIICIAAILAVAGVVVFLLLPDGDDNKTIPGTYADLYDAIANAPSGETILLEQSIVCAQEISFSKSLVLDLGGKSISAQNEFVVEEGVTLTVKNGAINANGKTTIKGNVVLQKDGIITCTNQTMYTASGSSIKVEGGKISVVNGYVECFGDVQMTSGTINKIVCYGNFVMSGGHVDSCSVNGTGTITGGSFGNANTFDPLRNYGTMLRVEGSQSNPVTITSKQWGFYSHNNTSSYLKNVEIDAEFEDLYTWGNLEVYDLELEGVTAINGQVKFENCKITDYNGGVESAFTNSSQLTLKNCTIESEGIAFSNFPQAKTVVENTVISGDVCGIMNYGELEIKSGTANGINVQTGSKTVVSGGTVTGSKKQIAIESEYMTYSGNAKIIINGGTVDAEDDGINGYALDVQINGGIIKGGDCGIWIGGISTLNVSGGTIKGNTALYVHTKTDTALSGGRFENGIRLEQSVMTGGEEKESSLATLLAQGYKYQSQDFFDENSRFVGSAVSVVSQ